MIGCPVQSAPRLASVTVNCLAYGHDTVGTMGAALTLTRAPCRLRALKPGVLPGLLAAPMRAALGPALRRVGCLADDQACRQCALPDQCAFGLAFAPLPPRPGWGGTPPRPYWLQYDQTTRRPLRPGDTIDVAIVAAPALVPHLGALADALTLAAARGLAGVPFIVADHSPAETYDLERCRREVAAWPDAVTVRFATPLRLKDRGRLRPVAPSLATLVKALTTRANALATLYGGTGWQPDLRKVVELATTSERVLDRTHWLGLIRHRHNHRPDSLSGLVGEVVYAPVDYEVKAWLAFASVLHAGADTVFGCGRVVAGPAPPPEIEPNSLQLVAALAAETVRRAGGPDREVAVGFASPDLVVVEADNADENMARAVRELSRHVGVTIRLVTPEQPYPLTGPEMSSSGCPGREVSHQTGHDLG
jgi:hypothetical protein